MRSGYDQEYEDQLFDADRVARRRLPPVRDRPLRRRPRLARRAVGEQLPVRPAQAARAGRRVRRGLRHGRRRLHEPRPLRAARRRRPDVQVVSILGEGSFHQVHGGTTTNQTDPAERARARVLVRRALRGAPRPARSSGPRSRSTTSAASAPRRRSVHAARRMTAKAFAVDDVEGGLDGPVPPAGAGARRAARRLHRPRTGGASRGSDTTWLGHTGRRMRPTDLLAYQEIVTEVRPDWIIETGTRDGGRALFLASVCDLLDHGQIVSIDATRDGPPARAPARHLHRGRAARARTTVEQVRRRRR